MFGIEASIRKGLGDIAQWRDLFNNERLKNAALQQEVYSLRAEVTRHVADKDWFKHRLNQVEMERAQLIYAATGGSGGRMRSTEPPAGREGVKIAAPQFAEGPPLSEVLNEQFNPFGTTGEDSADKDDQIPEAVREDLSHMPGFKG